MGNRIQRRTSFLDHAAMDETERTSMSTETEWVLCIGGKYGLEIHDVEPPCLLRRWIMKLVTAGSVRFYKSPKLAVGLGRKTYTDNMPGAIDCGLENVQLDAARAEQSRLLAVVNKEFANTMAEIDALEAKLKCPT